MNKKFKAALLIALLATFIILVLIPVKGYTYIQLPGQIESAGNYGFICHCPTQLPYKCGCAIEPGLSSQ